MSAGQIVQIIGAVVDVEFARDNVPNVYDRANNLNNLTCTHDYSSLTLYLIFKIYIYT